VRQVFDQARNLALSSWANAATARGGPKIATALCAITCCITLLYRARMSALRCANTLLYRARMPALYYAQHKLCIIYAMH